MDDDMGYVGESRIPWSSVEGAPKITTDPMKVLYELANECMHVLPVEKCMRCKIEATIPQVEAAFVEANEAFEIAKKQMVLALDARAKAEAQIAALKEKMNCGHPGACRIPAGSSISEPASCTACELARLERAAARQEERELCKGIPVVCPDCEEDLSDEVRREIKLLPPTADQSALDAHDAALLREKEISVVRHMKGSWHDGCQCEPCLAMAQEVKGQLDDLETQWVNACAIAFGAFSHDSSEGSIERAVVKYHKAAEDRYAHDVEVRGRALEEAAVYAETHYWSSFDGKMYKRIAVPEPCAAGIRALKGSK